MLLIIDNNLHQRQNKDGGFCDSHQKNTSDSTMPEKQRDTSSSGKVEVIVELKRTIGLTTAISFNVGSMIGKCVSLEKNVKIICIRKPK